MIEPRLYMVTLDTGNGFVWRYEVYADSENMARFGFMRRWLGMIISHDVRPSELKVEVA